MMVTWLQMNWLHEISQSALAAAIVVLGVVIMLELRSITLLKRAMDGHLGRVFEQLDLLRFDKQPIEVQATGGQSQQATSPPAAAASSPPTAGNAYAAAAALASTGMPSDEIARRCGLAAGEARLLASLAAARNARRSEG